MILYCSGIEYFTRTTAVCALCFFMLLTKFRHLKFSRSFIQDWDLEVLEISQPWNLQESEAQPKVNIFLSLFSFIQFAGNLALDL